MGAGPQPNYHEYDVCRTLWIIDTQGPIGRHLLRKEVELTECSVRTILKKLMSLAYIESRPQGQSITEAGKAYLLSLPYFAQARFLEAGDLSLGAYDYAIVTNSDASCLTNAIAQRDEAIKIGGDGATILIFRKGRLVMPPEFLDPYEAYPDDITRLLDTLTLSEGDIVVIGSGPSKRLAQLAAMAAFDAL
ncbi:MAG: DUF4443 domain-containing protein [Candidatus Methanofastidiosa archaeon]|nr:DUF4443 domain-containing protein [Candidatus Methanofastidiosa archaeon]